MNNHYQTLKVSRDAPAEVIRMAYKVLCQKYHPDKYPENRAAAEQIMKALNAAYAILSDPAKRKDYDDFLNEVEALNGELNKRETEQQSHKPKEEPKQESRHKTYDHKEKAKPQPNDFNHGTDNTPRPWRRFFARYVDYFFAAFIVGFFIGFFEQHGLLSQETSLGLMNPFILGFIATSVWVILESTLLTWFGNTPGKMLIGLRVVSSQQPPRYLNRAFSVWFRGIGLGLPFVWLITASLAHSRLKKTGLTSWDKDYGFTVEAYPIGVIHRTAAAGIILALFAANMLVGQEYRNQLSKSSHSYPSQARPTQTAEEYLAEFYPETPNDAQTQLNRGLAYYNGDGIPKNFIEAAKWYRLAANQGNAMAQYNLGLLYYKGQGVLQNHAEAAKWCRLAAEQGNAMPQFNLGLLYRDGDGIPKNFIEAAKWYRMAAEQGIAEAQFNLGLLYENGQGVPQNYAEAAKWWRMAANQGDANAQNNLGVLYRNGQGVPQNHAEAVKWWRMAAAQGQTDAQASLNRLNSNPQ